MSCGFIISNLRVPKVALCAHILELSGVLRFYFAKYRTTQMTYKNVDFILRTIPLVRGCALFGTMISGLYFLTYNSFGILTIYVLMGYFVCACSSFYIWRKYRKIPLKTEKNDSLKGIENVL